MKYPYRTINIPKPLAESIKKFIKENKEMGYRSLAEFCISSIREKFAEVKSDHPKEGNNEK